MCDPLEMGTWGESGHSWWSAVELGKRLGNGIRGAEGKVPCFPGQSPIENALYNVLYILYALCVCICVLS